MGVIFLLSSSLLAPHTSAEGTEELFGSLNYVMRKCAHVAEYAVLAYLWFRSIRPRAGGIRSRLGWSVLLSVLYAATDELHQALIPERLGTWSDVVFDTAGALGGALALWAVWRRGRPEFRDRVLGSPTESAS
jgi:VanZ family protein